MQEMAVDSAHGAEPLHAHTAASAADALAPDPDTDIPFDLPPPFSAWAERVARAACAPVDYVVLSLLTVAAGLVGGLRRVSPAPGWAEPCVLWTALVGDPGWGKSRGMEAVLRLVRTLQRDVVSDTARRRQATLLEWAREHMRRWRKALRATPDDGEPPEMPVAALPPAPPRQLLIDEPQVAAAARALHGSPGRLLLAPEALASWLGRILRQRSGNDRRWWLKAWKGLPWSVAQRGAPDLDIACAAVSLLGTVRPDGLAALDVPDDEGNLLDRFLFAAPLWRASVEPLAQEPVAPETEVIRALARLRDLDTTARELTLDAEAQAAFETFRREHEELLGELKGREAAWASKGPAMVLRLAGTLVLLSWAALPDGRAEPAQVLARAMDAAISMWWHRLWPQACQALGLIERRNVAHHVERTIRWLRHRGAGEVSREDIRREALSQQIDAEETDRVIDRLVEDDWLTPMEKDPTRRPGRPPRRWLINPLRLGPPFSLDDPPTAQPGRAAPAAPLVALPRPGLTVVVGTRHIAEDHGTGPGSASASVPAAAGPGRSIAGPEPIPAVSAIPATAVNPGSAGACPEASERVPAAFARSEVEGEIEAVRPARAANGSGSGEPIPAVSAATPASAHAARAGPEAAVGM